MREMIISAILNKLPKHETPYDNFNNMRWASFAELIGTFRGVDIASKAWRKNLREFKVERFELEAMTDEQLLQLFEAVVHRYYIQM